MELFPVEQTASLLHCDTSHHTFCSPAQ